MMTMMMMIVPVTVAETTMTIVPVTVAGTTRATTTDVDQLDVLGAQAPNPPPTRSAPEPRLTIESLVRIGFRRGIAASVGLLPAAMVISSAGKDVTMEVEGFRRRWLQRRLRRSPATVRRMPDSRQGSAHVDEPVSVRAVMFRFALTGFVALIIVSLVTAWVSRRVGTDQAIDDAERIALVSSQGIVAPVLEDAVLDLDADALDDVDSAVRQYVLRGSLVRVKIWDADGTIVYSDESRLIGEHFDLPADKQRVFDTGESHAEISDLGNPENRFEEGTKMLEVYQPISTVEGTPLLFETYFLYSGVSDVGRRLWGQFAPVAIGALIALQLVQFPFAYRMARRLREGQEERELLLQRAIDASDAERRRIASDLHDGVVQDLTGVSLGLAALGRQDSIDPTEASEASASIRTSIKSLRSLLVEIYPPNLSEEGLESAVGDLLSGLPARGIATDLAIEVDDLSPSDESVAMVYRIVQEAIRNVVSHASATAVRVEISVGENGVDVMVDDNGRGFDVDEAAQRSMDGHVGLRALGGLLADAGGTFEVLSSKGTGTRVAATVPFNVRVPA
jgi:signal transduction histidine kinase